MNIKTIANFLTLVVIMIGGIFKIQHWPGANEMLLVGTLLLFVAVFFTIKDMSIEGVPSFLRILISLTLVLHVLGATFKSMHWGGGQMLMMIAYVLTVISVIALILNKVEVKVPRQLVITLFLFLILVMNILVRT